MKWNNDKEWTKQFYEIFPKRFINCSRAVMREIIFKIISSVKRRAIEKGHDKGYWEGRKEQKIVCEIEGKQAQVEICKIIEKMKQLACSHRPRTECNSLTCPVKCINQTLDDVIKEIKK